MLLRQKQQLNWYISFDRHIVQKHVSLNKFYLLHFQISFFAKIHYFTFTSIIFFSKFKNSTSKHEWNTKVPVFQEVFAMLTTTYTFNSMGILYTALSLRGWED